MNNHEFRSYVYKQNPELYAAIETQVFDETFVAQKVDISEYQNKTYIVHATQDVIADLTHSVSHTWIQTWIHNNLINQIKSGHHPLRILDELKTQQLEQGVSNQDELAQKRRELIISALDKISQHFKKQYKIRAELDQVFANAA